MGVRNQIEAIVTAAPINAGFIYGTANEINYKADSGTVWPVVALYPLQPVTITLGLNGSADNVYSLYVEILYKTKFEKNTADNEPLINQAIALANQFLVNMRMYREPGQPGRYFKWIPGTQVNCLPVYNAFDVNTCGVALTFKVKLMNDPKLSC